MTPPPRFSKVRWSGRWDQQYDSVVLMVESICGHAREVEEDWQKKLVKLGLKEATKNNSNG
jgi:hypothetical protein